MGWEVFSKSEVMPKWEGKWKWNKYARAYNDWARFECNTLWLFSQKNRNLQKKLKGYERTQTLFCYFENKKGDKIPAVDFFKKRGGQ